MTAHGLLVAADFLQEHGFPEVVVTVLRDAAESESRRSAMESEKAIESAFREHHRGQWVVIELDGRAMVTRQSAVRLLHRRGLVPVHSGLNRASLAGADFETEHLLGMPVEFFDAIQKALESYEWTIARADRVKLGDELIAREERFRAGNRASARTAVS